MLVVINTNINNNFAKVSPDFAVILDGLSYPGNYSKSSHILKEISRCKPDLRVTYAYSLAGGGICIHLPDKLNFELALQTWPEDSFDFSPIRPHPPAAAVGKASAFVKNVSVFHSCEFIEQEILENHRITASVKRLTDHKLHQPIPVIKIVADTADTISLIQSGVIINKLIHRAEESHHRIVRCFRCQLFGHTASSCHNDHTCAVCGQNHHTSFCLNPVCCPNCRGNHPADSRACPVFIQLKQLLNSRRQERQNEGPTTEH